VDPQDGWEVHFRDTMKGGSFLNHWRMAQLHAQEAPDRVRELEQWGALFDRTRDGRILQRAFGGHTYKRLAHVGDRTGLEMIRTLQDRAVQFPNLEVYMECAVTKLFLDGGRVAGAFGYRRAELSTRDNVSRAIYTEVKEGRGSPHGGVFLDISYLPAERVKQKLPSMYHQFSELADVDITKTPMEVGPTMHYLMGGIRVDP